MKEFKLIAFEDLAKIAVYLDRIDDLFPVKSVPELIRFRELAHEALGKTMDAGNEGAVHAKLDEIMRDVGVIAGKIQLADKIAGPAVNLAGRINPAELLRDVPRGRITRPGVVDQTLADIEFDDEGGEIL